MKNKPLTISQAMPNLQRIAAAHRLRLGRASEYFIAVMLLKITTQMPVGYIESSLSKYIGRSIERSINLN